MTHPWLKHQTKTARDFLQTKFKLDSTREPKFHSNRVVIPIVLIGRDNMLEKTVVDISDIAFSILLRQIQNHTDEFGIYKDQIWTFERDQKDRVIIMEVKA